MYTKIAYKCMALQWNRVIVNEFWEGNLKRNRSLQHKEMSILTNEHIM